MQFPDIQQLSLPQLKFIEPCLKLFVTNETAKKCMLVMLSASFGAIAGACTAALFTWNITVCIAVGAVTSVIALVAFRILCKSILENLKQPLNPVQPKEKLKRMVELALHGNKDAIRNVCEQYKNGFRVTDSPELNIKYLTIVEAQEDQDGVQAGYELGLLFFNREPADYSEAIKYLGVAAMLGHNDALQLLYKIHDEIGFKDQSHGYQLIAQEKKLPQAQYEYGLFLADEGGTGSNYPLACQCMELAAKQGHVDAQLFLGKMYREQKDWERASDYYRQAMDQGNTKAKELYNRLNLNLDEVD